MDKTGTSRGPAPTMSRWRPLCALATCLVVVGFSGGSARAASGFAPVSVTFVSSSTGWVLGTAPCAAGRACLALRETTDGGRSWIVQPLPASLVAAAGSDVASAADSLAGLSVRFADSRNGWIFGGVAVKGAQGDSVEPALWTTHDGGLHWRKQRLAGIQGPVFDVEAANGTVHLIAMNTKIAVTAESSPVAEDRWQVSNAVTLGLPAGGGEVSGSIVLSGANGWLVEGNDRGTTGSARLARNGRWVSWTPPCASVGGSFAAPAASTADDLVAVCVMGGFASPLSKSAPRGATLGSTWLYVSTDGGKVFRAGPELARRRDVFFGVLASPSPGVIVLGRVGTSSEDLRASFDGGAHWAVVYRGEVGFLGFTSPTQGVGIVRSSGGATSMIMTVDGGRHWRRVSF